MSEAKTTSDAKAAATAGAKAGAVASRHAPIWLYGLIVFVTQLDGGAVSTMLSTMSKTFALNSVSASWISGLYTLALVVGTPITSNLSDVYGTKRVFLSELVLWFVGCLMTAVSPNYALMLAGRFIQGIGDSGIIVLSMNVLLQDARRNHQGRKVSIVGIIVGFSSVVSPIICGILLGVTRSWRIFYVGMLPVLAVLFILTWVLLDDRRAGRRMRTDYAGLCSFSIAIASLMLAITFAQQAGRQWALMLVLLVVAVVAFMAFVAVERKLDRGTMPFLPLGLFRNRSYVLTLVLSCVGGMFFALFVYIPTFAQTMFHMSPRAAGMLLVHVGIGSLLGAWVGGLLVDRFGIKHTLVLSSVVIVVAGVAMVATLNQKTGFKFVLVLLGLGMGALMSAPLQVVAGRVAAPQQRMQAIGGVSAMKKVGLTIAPLLFASAMTVGMAHGALTASSFRDMFLTVVVIAVVCVVAACLVPADATLQQEEGSAES